MSEIWAAAIGAVISTGLGVAASKASQPGFGGAPPVKFNPIDVSDLANKATASDINAYKLGDQDLVSRGLGNLALGNKTNISNAVTQLTGPLNPTVQNAFATDALEKSLATSGGGNAYAGVGPIGSASGNTAASVLANDVTQKQDYDRTALDQAIQLNPQRQIGLSGETTTQLNIGNASNLNDYNIGKYQYQVQKDASGGGGF